MNIQPFHNQSGFPGVSVVRLKQVQPSSCSLIADSMTFTKQLNPATNPQVSRSGTFWRNHRLSLVLMLSLLTHASWAGDSEDKRPLGCKDVGYQFELNTLSLLPQDTGDRQSLYFIYNALNRPINLYQMRPDDSTKSLFLNHTIMAGQWGALATSEKELKYICTVDDAKSTYGKIVNCNESVRVCEYARVKFGLNNKGNYWIVSSNTRDAAVRDVTHYGIIPR